MNQAAIRVLLLLDCFDRQVAPHVLGKQLVELHRFAVTEIHIDFLHRLRQISLHVVILFLTSSRHRQAVLTPVQCAQKFILRVTLLV